MPKGLLSHWIQVCMACWRQRKFLFHLNNLSQYWHGGSCSCPRTGPTFYFYCAFPSILWITEYHVDQSTEAAPSRCSSLCSIMLLSLLQIVSLINWIAQGLCWYSSDSNFFSFYPSQWIHIHLLGKFRILPHHQIATGLFSFTWSHFSTSFQIAPSMFLVFVSPIWTSPCAPCTTFK